MNIEILCTGDEILSGKTVNTNYSYMARRLVEQGFDVRWGTVVGDDRKDLADAFATASGRADIVIVNGGLGPTVDDLSQEVAADAAGVALCLHEDWLSRMEAWYRSRGRTMPDNNRKQAMIPEGAEFIDNPIGTACGFALDIGRARFFFTPGVPREMRRMVDEQVLPRLQRIRGGTVLIRLKRFHSFGIGESRADKLLDGIEALAPTGAVKLGFQSHYPQLETKLVLRGEDAAAMDDIMAPVAAAVRERIGDFILAEDDETLEGRIMARLVAQDRTLAVAEMHSGGAMGGRLMAAQDHPGRVRCTLVSQDPAELARMCGADAGVAGPDDPGDTAAGLAIALARRAVTDWALVLMTRPGDDPETGSEPRSVVAVGIASPENGESRVAILPGSREWMRLGAGELALDCLRRRLEGLPVYQKIDFEQH